MTSVGNGEDVLVEINPEALDFRAASGLYWTIATVVGHVVSHDKAHETPTTAHEPHMYRASTVQVPCKYCASTPEATPEVTG